MSLVAIVFGKGKLPGFEVGDKSLPAVVMLQEWWGVTPVVKAQAEKLSADGGFRVLVPDLYKGKLGVTREEAHHLMGNLDFQEAVKEIAQATKYLKETGAPKVGICGFCMGGALSFAAAQHVPELSCAVPCYGIPNASHFQIDQIKIPILGIFGDKDTHKGFSDTETALAAEAKVKAAGGDIKVEIYPSGVHGFLNQVIGQEGIDVVQTHQGAVATQEDAQAAWDSMTAFFKKHLL